MSFPELVGMAPNNPSHVRDAEGNIYSKKELFDQVKEHFGSIAPIEIDYEEEIPSPEVAANNAQETFLSKLEESVHDEDYTGYVEVDGHIDRIGYCILNGLGTPENYDEADELCGDEIIDAIGEFLKPFFDADPESETTGDVYSFPIWYKLTLYGL